MRVLPRSREPLDSDEGGGRTSIWPAHRKTARATCRLRSSSRVSIVEVMPTRWFFVVSIAALVLAACSGENAIRRFTPADADARARAYLALFTRGQPDSAAARLVPALAGADAQRELVKIGAILRDQHFDSTKLIGAQVNSINGVRHVNLSYELHSSRGWSVANVATVDSANTWFVEGVSANMLARRLEDDARFTLAGKPARQYAWLLMSILCFVASLATAIFVATRRAMPKRWRWVLVSLLGLGAFSLNWNTGVVATNLVSIRIGAASFTRAAPVVPWIITFSLPIGALSAFLQYRHWRAEATKIAEPVPIAAPDDT